MSTDRERSVGNERFGAEPLRHWLNSRIRRKLALGEARSGSEPLPKPGQKSQPATHHISRLERCCENVFDAYTVESAIFWHCEIISEISGTIVKIREAVGEGAEAVRLIASLDDRQQYHTEAVNRLTGILQRNENFVWRP